MNRFYTPHFTGENCYGQKTQFCIISKRLAGLIQKSKKWINVYYNLQSFTVYDEEYLAVMISSKGLILLIKNNEVDQHIQRDCCTELMALVVRKNENLSFYDLIKFSKKHGFDVNINFKKAGGK